MQKSVHVDPKPIMMSTGTMPYRLLTCSFWVIMSCNCKFASYISISETVQANTKVFKGKYFNNGAF